MAMEYEVKLRGERDELLMTEVETVVSDGAAARRLLEGLGYGLALRYQKYRTPFRYPDCDALAVTLDETPLGCFLEIEGEPAAIHRCAAALGFSRADYGTRSYLEIHRAESGAGDMVFDQEPRADTAANTGTRPAT